MGASNETTANLQQNVTNSILQQQSAVCNNTCTQIADNTVSIVINSTVRGNVGVNESCNINGSCVIGNSMDANASTILSAITNQTNTAATDSFALTFTENKDTSTIIQDISNIITQITTSTCQSNTINGANNTYSYVADSDVGSVGVNLDSDPKVNCTLNNISKAVSYNQTQATADQNNTSIGMFSLLFIAIIVIFVIGGILVVALFATGLVGKAVGGRKGTEAPSKPGLEQLTTEQLNIIASELKAPI